MLVSKYQHNLCLTNNCLLSNAYTQEYRHKEPTQEGFISTFFNGHMKDGLLWKLDDLILKDFFIETSNYCLKIIQIEVVWLEEKYFDLYCLVSIKNEEVRMC